MAEDSAVFTFNILNVGRSRDASFYSALTKNVIYTGWAHMQVKSITIKLSTDSPDKTIDWPD